MDDFKTVNTKIKVGIIEAATSVFHLQPKAEKRVSRKRLRASDPPGMKGDGTNVVKGQSSRQDSLSSKAFWVNSTTHLSQRPERRCNTIDMINTSDNKINLLLYQFKIITANKTCE